ncbi:MAG TPA: EAL domain-containing protein [Allosphingosinicella sp.]|nr:EAL domain-containing protein [Allosphingosinicella sp.]
MTCAGCRDGKELNFGFSMAFQPIVDIRTGDVSAYEALVRGPEQQGAKWVLDQVTEENRYAFDQQCRVKAIEVAVAAGLLDSSSRLSINFLPNAVYSPLACIQLTLKTARATGLPTDRLIFEFTENEQMDPEHVGSIVAAYRQMGFGTALDDFGAGHSGLALLARFQPHAVKLDRELIENIDASLPRRLIVEAVVRMCEGLGVRVIAEGVERAEEARTLQSLGVHYMQGYLFARPQFERLPSVDLPASSLSAAA